MKNRSILIFVLVTGTIVSGTLAAFVVQERQQRAPRKITRVKRPQFTERDWDGIYFENLFEEGLVGERPKQLAPGAGTANPTQIANEAAAEDKGGAFAWSKYIAGSTIEDEVKAIQLQLTKDVTTPIKFKSEYNKAHQSFSILSMLFGVVREYDDDVRWKKYAPEAQISFERAAANSRVGTIQAYESCKRRLGDLQEMVRGGTFAASEKPVEKLDWSIVIDRNPIMNRLEASRVTLKELTSNENAFKADVGKVFHETQMVAAMAQTLIRENMLDADDDGYSDYAKAMSAAATQAAEACKTQNFEEVSKAVNLIGQSCSNCHDDWK